MKASTRFGLCMLIMGCLGTSGARADSAGDPARHTRAVQVIVDYDTGPLYVLQNDGRYGAAGTAFTAAEIGQKDNLYLSRRMAVEIAWARRHTLVLLYAPFASQTRVTLDKDIVFRDTMFPQGSVVDHRYLFDGYRASYAYGILRGAVDLDVGASLQIRNAQVAFASADGALHAAESDIGPVFAIKTRVGYQSDRAGLFAMFEADALSTFGLIGNVEGGIYDLALTVGMPASPALDVLVRARLLGGGARVPAREIDNFANFAALTAGVRVHVDRIW